MSLVPASGIYSLALGMTSNKCNNIVSLFPPDDKHENEEGEEEEDDGGRKGV